MSGAETSDDVIAYWDGLKSKEVQMRELVRLAEQREAAAKAEISSMLEGRGEGGYFSPVEGGHISPGRGELRDGVRIRDAKGARGELWKGMHRYHIFLLLLRISLRARRGRQGERRRSRGRRGAQGGGASPDGDHACQV